MPTVLLDWHDSAHLARPAPCVLCETTTPLRAHSGEPVHKTCAEFWNAANPGEARFMSDPPKRPGRVDDA